MAFGLTDGSGVSGTGGASDTFSFTFTAGVNLAVFFLRIRQSISSDETTTGTPTFNGSNCTNIGNVEGGRTRIEIWAIDNPDTGSAYDFACNYTGTSTPSDAYCVGYGYTDADVLANATVTTAAQLSDSQEFSSLAADSAVDDIVVDMFAADGTITGITVGASQAEDASSEATADWLGASHETATGVTTTMSWTYTTSRNRRHAAVAVGESVTVSSAPAAPTNLSATGSGDTVSLTWTDTNAAAFPYRVYGKRTTDAQFNWLADTAIGAESYIDEWLVADTSYSYRVTGWDDPNESEFDTATATTGTVRLVSGSFL